jgi:hypothetical protein
MFKNDGNSRPNKCRRSSEKQTIASGSLVEHTTQVGSAVS